MRFLTIVLALLVGVVLGIVFLNNGHGVNLNLAPFVKTPLPPATPYRIFPLWVVMVVCALIGFFLGWLFGITGSYAAPPPGPSSPPPKKQAERDYLVIDTVPDRRS